LAIYDLDEFRITDLIDIATYLRATDSKIKVKISIKETRGLIEPAKK